MKKQTVYPTKLRFSIGGFGPWVEIEWQVARLNYREGFMGEMANETLEISPSARKWQYFWRAVNKAQVWEWLPNYKKEILDGTGWGLELEYEGKSIASNGSNDFPGGEGEGSQFNIFLRALQRLTGQRGIW